MTSHKVGKLSGLLVLALLGVGGVALAQATASTMFEAESGTRSGQVTLASDSAASGTSYIAFTDSIPSATSFLETFDGTPTNPEPWNNMEWDVFQTIRDRASWENPEPVNAHHAAHNCGDVAAGATHLVTTWADTVFKCNGHVMTAIDGEVGGYGAIVLSPPAMADFSQGSSTIKFDVSTFFSSSRDWIDVWITPFDGLMSYPLDITVDGGGPPPNGLHIRQDGPKVDNWQFSIMKDGQLEYLGYIPIPYTQFGGPSRVVRTPVQIDVTTTSLTLSYPTLPGVSRTVNFPAISWNQGVVQFGHHAYTPEKGCDYLPDLPNCGVPNTWHWDNISINPAKRFYQYQALPERSGYISNSNVRQINFQRQTPANAQLVWGGTCGVEFRDSPTAPWRRATIIHNVHIEHQQSYKITIPEGMTSIDYRFVANGGWTPSGYGCQLMNPTVKALM